jgi:hypothetical protein
MPVSVTRYAMTTAVAAGANPARAAAAMAGRPVASRPSYDRCRILQLVDTERTKILGLRASRKRHDSQREHTHGQRLYEPFHSACLPFGGTNRSHKDSTL